MALPPATRARLQAGLAVLLASTLWWYHRGPFTATVALLAATLALLAWLSPRHHAPIQKILDRGARLLAAGFSWLILALVYFGVFTPLRLLRSLARHSLMPLRPAPRTSDSSTYLQPLRPRTPRHFERQF